MSRFILKYAIYLLLVQYALMYYLGSYFNVFDKIVLLLGFAILPQIVSSKFLPKLAKVSFAIFFVSGVLGGVFSHFQPLKSIFQDSLLHLKFFFSLSIGYYCFRRIDFRRFDRYNKSAAKLIIIVLAILTLLNHVFGDYVFDLAVDTRFGFRCIRLFFWHPTFYVGAVMFWFSVYVSSTDMSMRKMGNLLCLFLVFFMILSAGRYKGLGVLFIFLYFCFADAYKIKHMGALKYANILLGGVVGLYLVLDQLLFYYGSNSEVGRAAALIASFRIVADYFPFGTGFGTFCSSAALSPYSPVYQKYGLDHVYGFMEKEPAFTADNYVATLLGQNGVCVIFFVVFLCYLFKKIYELKKINVHYFRSALLLFMYLCFCSIGECTFVAVYSVPMGLWIGFMISQLSKWNTIDRRAS